MQKTIHSRRLLMSVGTWACLAISFLLALLNLVESRRMSIPCLVNDEWEVVQRMSSGLLSDVIWLKHNGVPTYYQNLVWWLDYRLFDLRGNLPRGLQDGMMLAGLLVLVHLLRRSDLTSRQLMWTVSLILGVWYTEANSAQFNSYVWCGFEKSLAFLLLSVSLCFLVAMARAKRKRTILLLAALAAAWAALYVHGGFGVFPVIAIVVLLMRPGRALSIITLSSLSLFILHFREVHYQPRGLTAEVASVWEWLYGFCVLVSAIPYQFLKPHVGPTGAGILAGAITLITLGALGRLTAKTLRRQSNALDTIALGFLGYASLLALAVVLVRVRFRGWEYATAARYSSISALILVGLMLAWIARAREMARVPQRFPLHLIGGASMLMLLLFSWQGSIRLLYGSPMTRHRYEIFMIPYTLDPWSLLPSGESTQIRLRAAHAMRETLVSGRKGVFGSNAYLRYLDCQTAASDATLSSDTASRLNIRHVGPIPGSGDRLLRVRVRWPKEFSPKDYLCIFMVDGRKAGWALPNDSPIVPRWLMKGSPSRIVARGFAVAPSESNELYAVLVDERGKWSYRTDATPIR